MASHFQLTIHFIQQTVLGFLILIYNVKIYFFYSAFTLIFWDIYITKSNFYDNYHTGQCLRRIAGGNTGLPLDTT